MADIRVWRRRVVASLALVALAAPALALDLLESYEAALAGDAEYRAARAAAEAGREMLPMARAQLLPNLAINMSHMRNDLKTHTVDALKRPYSYDSEYDSKNYALVLRQPLYRPAQYAGYEQAAERVAGVEAVFDKARQEVAVRVVGAYLNVLLAEETVRQMEAEERAIETQLAAARRALELGHGTRTDVDDARARLDVNRARLLGARQQIDQARHELEMLIERPATGVKPLDGNRLALAVPVPGELESWIDRAEAASPELREMRAREEIARHELTRARAGHKPTLDLVVQRSISDSDSVTNVGNQYYNSQIGLQLAVPLYAGGYVNAQVRQAQAALEEAGQRHEAARRRLSAQVRKEFRGVQEGLPRIAALEQAERSADQAVASSDKGVLAGTRTRVDVLNAEQKRAETRLELVRERLSLAISHARLLALCGALDRDAVGAMNRWLVE